jgi:pimeloyl-ACP methyl ester carboxylesterase
MAMTALNGVRLAYEMSGTGEVPLVMVHGDMESRRTWDGVVPHLADSFRVLTYDRRGYGESEPPRRQSSIREDVADLAALIEHLGLAPTWVTGQSGGAVIVLRLAGERPDLLRGIAAHEPGLFGLIADDPVVGPMLESFAPLVAAVTERIASGDHAGGAKRFVEEGLGEGLWNKFPPEFRQDVIDNAPNALDDLNDPEGFAFDLEWIRGFPHPVLLTQGDQTAPVFPPVITELANALPSAEVREFTGAGHPIQGEQPEEYARAVESFILENDRQWAGRSVSG